MKALLFIFLTNLSFAQTTKPQICLGNSCGGKIPQHEISNTLFITHKDSLKPLSNYIIDKWEVVLPFVGIKGKGDTLADELVTFIRESINQRIIIVADVRFPDKIFKKMILEFEVVE